MPVCCCLGLVVYHFPVLAHEVGPGAESLRRKLVQVKMHNLDPIPDHTGRIPEKAIKQTKFELQRGHTRNHVGGMVAGAAGNRPAKSRAVLVSDIPP